MTTEPDIPLIRQQGTDCCTGLHPSPDGCAGRGIAFGFWDDRLVVSVVIGETTAIAILTPEELDQAAHVLAELIEGANRASMPSLRGVQ